MGELPTWIQDNMSTDQTAPQNWIDPTNIKKLQETKSAEEDIRRMENGHSLELIEKIGWNNFRELLKQSSYTKIARNLLAQADQLDSAQAVAPDEDVRSSNTSAKERAYDLCQTLPKDDYTDGNKFKQELDKKLWSLGQDVMLNPSLGNPTLRIYIGTPTKNSPEIFQSIVAKIKEAGVISKADIALNLENYQGDSLDNPQETNNLVIYARTKDDTVITRIVAAIRQAKEENPDLWNTNPKDLAKLKKGLAWNFKVPIDDQISIVEQTHSDSYDVGDTRSILMALGLGVIKTPDENIAALERNSGISFDQTDIYLRGRNAKMPGMIFEEGDQQE